MLLLTVILGILILTVVWGYLFINILDVIHTIKPTNAQMLKLYFYTQFVLTATCFDLS